jgi:hypothetical protein
VLILVLEQLLAEAERLGVLRDPHTCGFVPSNSALRIFYMFRARWHKGALQGLPQLEREQRQRQLLLLSNLLVSRRRCAARRAGRRWLLASCAPAAAAGTACGCGAGSRPSSGTARRLEDLHPPNDTDEDQDEDDDFDDDAEEGKVLLKIERELGEAAKWQLPRLLARAQAPECAAGALRALAYLASRGVCCVAGDWHVAGDALAAGFAACCRWQAALERGGGVGEAQQALPAPGQAPGQAPAAEALQQQLRACSDTLVQQFRQLMAACAKEAILGDVQLLLLALLERCCRQQPGSGRLLCPLAGQIVQCAAGGHSLEGSELKGRADARQQALALLEPWGQQLPPLEQLYPPLPEAAGSEQQSGQQQQQAPQEAGEQASAGTGVVAQAAKAAAHLLALHMLQLLGPAAGQAPQLQQLQGWPACSTEELLPRANALAALLEGLTADKHAREAQAAADSTALLPRLWQLWNGCPDSQLQGSTCIVLHRLRWLVGGQLVRLGAHTQLGKVLEVGAGP